MIYFLIRLERFLVVLSIISVVLLGSGCAAIQPEKEEEGGISGTGNSINCSDEISKKNKRCN